MKKTLFILLAFVSSIGLAQDVPPNPETGKCYLKCKKGEILQWTEVPCDLTTSIAQNTNYIKELQTRYKNLGYDINVTGELDFHTIEVHKDYQNGMKNLKRQQRRAARKSRRKKKAK